MLVLPANGHSHSSPQPPSRGGGEVEVCGNPTIAPLLEAAPLFEAAIDVLVVMHRATPPPDLPAWDAAAMRDTALATLLDWWWPAMFAAPAPEAARARAIGLMYTMMYVGDFVNPFGDGFTVAAGTCASEDDGNFEHGNILDPIF